MDRVKPGDTFDFNQWAELARRDPATSHDVSAAFLHDVGFVLRVEIRAGRRCGAQCCEQEAVRQDCPGSYLQEEITGFEIRMLCSDKILKSSVT